MNDSEQDNDFGPQTPEIKALIEQVRSIGPFLAEWLFEVWGTCGLHGHSRWLDTFGAISDATEEAGRNSERLRAREAVVAAAQEAQVDEAIDAATDAAHALVVWDLIGQYGLTRTHYDRHTRPWAKVVGPVHPNDLPIN